PSCARLAAFWQRQNAGAHARPCAARRHLWRSPRRARVSASPVPFGGEARERFAIMSGLTQPAPRKARETDGFACRIAALPPSKPAARQHPLATARPARSGPGSARGYSVANSYLLTQSEAAMLIDPGFGKDEPVIRAQIESLIAPGLPLSLFPLRLNEFMSINNVETFAGHFNVETCYTSNVDAALWFDFGAKAQGRDILESMK